jgi:hypothetical protein
MHLTNQNQAVSITEPTSVYEQSFAEIMTAIMEEQIQARQEAQESLVQLNMNNLRFTMELWYNENDFSYVNGCQEASVNDSLQNIGMRAGASRVTTDTTSDFLSVTCNDSEDAYAITVPLYASDQMWCVDSSGYAGVAERTALSSGTDYTCAE